MLTWRLAPSDAGNCRDASRARRTRPVCQRERALDPGLLAFQVRAQFRVAPGAGSLLSGPGWRLSCRAMIVNSRANLCVTVFLKFNFSKT